MATIDFRTRSDSDVLPVDLGSFVDEQVAGLLNSPRSRNGSGSDPTRPPSPQP